MGFALSAKVPVHPTESSPPNQPTRFVEHPARRRAWRKAQRNLTWGVAFLFAALSLLGVAMFIGGARAMLPVVLCMLSFTALWVLARMKVFAQRNGVFFSLAIIALLGAVAALIEQGWTRLANRPNEPRVATSERVTTSLSGLASPELPRLTEAMKLEDPDPALPRARATRDLLTTIGGKDYRILRGEVFLVADEKPGEVVLSANEFLARVPSDSMEILMPTATPTARRDDGRSALDKKIDLEVTKKAQAEAARRFPALSQAGSEENRLFLEAYNDLKRRQSDLLDDPEWPLELAQTLAKRLGWKEVGAVEEDRPPVVESKLAPGTRVLAPTEDEFPEPSEPVAPPPPAAEEPDIPPPPQVPPGR